MKFMKVGRVAIITRGRYAGKKVRQTPPPTMNMNRKEMDDMQATDFDKRTHWKEKKYIRERRGTGNAQKFQNANQAFFPSKQVVIVQPNDAGSKSHPFSYAIVAGIERYPLKVTRGMGKKLVDRRSRIKPFIKVVNYNHLMPTRYTLELEGLKGTVSNDTFKEVSQREDAKKNIKKALEDRYTSGKNRWFFTALRF
ncbi:hypothetical protein MYU51_009869 [Penicillium brevicompactum]